MAAFLREGIKWSLSQAIRTKTALFCASRRGGWGDNLLEMPGKRVKAGAMDEEETAHTAPANGMLQILRSRVNAPVTPAANLNPGTFRW